VVAGSQSLPSFFLAFSLWLPVLVLMLELLGFLQRLNQRRRLRYGISQVDLEFGGFYQDLLRDEDDECCLILESYDDDVGAGD
tara:strand:- start:499 stop:747 length:249 start_codon:yes stop_codon:yes gene_type:complete